MFAVSACTVTVRSSNGKVTRYNPLNDMVTAAKKSSEKKKELNKQLVKAIADDDLLYAHKLIKQGANVNAYTNDHKNFPLQYAKSLNMTKLLIETGANPNLRDNDGDNALDMAYLEGRPEIANYLKEKGVKGKNPNDLLFRAIGDKREHSTDEVKNLIKCGADVNSKHKDGYSPLEFALYQERPDRARILIENGAKLTTAKQKELAGEVLLKASESNNSELIRSLIAQGVDINVKDSSGFTPLHNIAKYYSDTETARLLIDNGADVHQKTRDGYTTLELAYMGGHSETAKLMKEKGVVGKNPTDLLWLMLEKNNKSTITELVKSGADVNAKNSKGWTPLDVAESKDNADMVKTLTDLGGTHSNAFMQAQRKNNIFVIGTFQDKKDGLVKVYRSYENGACVIFAHSAKNKYHTGFQARLSRNQCTIKQSVNYAILTTNNGSSYSGLKESGILRIVKDIYNSLSWLPENRNKSK